MILFSSHPGLPSHIRNWVILWDVHPYMWEERAMPVYLFIKRINKHESETVSQSISGIIESWINFFFFFKCSIWPFPIRNCFRYRLTLSWNFIYLFIFGFNTPTFLYFCFSGPISFSFIIIFLYCDNCRNLAIHFLRNDHIFIVTTCNLNFAKDTLFIDETFLLLLLFWSMKMCANINKIDTWI